MVIRVDENDRPVGFARKMCVHRLGLLHRAFSVQIFTLQGAWLLQRRAPDKYHSGGLWSNTCCSHPAPGTDTAAAAAARLLEEMGLKAELHPAGLFRYRADVGGGLTEHELDHLFTGITDELPRPDPAEVADFRYVFPEELQAELARHPERFTPWFRILAQRFGVVGGLNPVEP